MWNIFMLSTENFYFEDFNVQLSAKALFGNSLLFHLIQQNISF